jgi:hypothetical protein
MLVRSPRRDNTNSKTAVGVMLAKTLTNIVSTAAGKERWCIIVPAIKEVVTKFSKVVEVYSLTTFILPKCNTTNSCPKF